MPDRSTGRLELRASNINFPYATHVQTSLHFPTYRELREVFDDSTVYYTLNHALGISLLEKEPAYPFLADPTQVIISNLTGWATTNAAGFSTDNTKDTDETALGKFGMYPNDESNNVFWFKHRFNPSPGAPAVPDSAYPWLAVRVPPALILNNLGLEQLVVQLVDLVAPGGFYFDAGFATATPGQFRGRFIAIGGNTPFQSFHIGTQEEIKRELGFNNSLNNLFGFLRDQPNVPYWKDVYNPATPTVNADYISGSNPSIDSTRAGITGTDVQTARSRLILGRNASTNFLVQRSATTVNLKGPLSACFHSSVLGNEHSFTSNNRHSAEIARCDLHEVPFGGTATFDPPDTDVHTIQFSEPRQIQNIDLRLLDQLGAPLWGAGDNPNEHSYQLALHVLHDSDARDGG
jgi:hypothetical protein